MKKQLKRMALFKNPPTQNRMAEILGVSVATVNRTLFDKLQLRVRKKKKVQQLSEAQIKNRRERAPGFKQVVDDNKDTILATDEAYFSVQLGHNGQREIHYVSVRKQGESSSQENVKFIEREERFAPKVMVWAGVSYHSKTSLYFVEKGAKINSEYYQKYVLKKFLKRDRQ